MPCRFDNKPWTSEEDDLLRRVYGTVPVKDLPSVVPGRTRAACSGRAQKLGIRPPKEPAWSETDLEVLRQRYGRVSPRKIAKELGRTPEAVHIKATRLKLHGRKRRLTPRTIAGMMHICSKQVKRWIDEGLLKAELLYRSPHKYHAVMPDDLIEFLKAHPERWDARRCPDLHTRLGIKSKRTWGAPDERPLWLKEKLAADIRRGRRAKRWTPAEDLQLAQLFRQGLKYREIGKRMGRSEAAIDHRVHRLGKRVWELLKQGA